MTTGSERAPAFAAYRRRLGPDADGLPTDYTTLVENVAAFSDPVLTDDLPEAARWDTATTTWQL